MTTGKWIVGAAAVTLALGVGIAGSGTRPEPAGGVGEDITVLSGGITFFEQRLAADPENFLAAAGLVNRYLLRYQLGADSEDVERAEEISRELVRMAPDRADALARLSHVHLMQHDFTSAWEAAERAVAADSTDPDAHAALFTAAMASGRYDRAETALRRLDPRSVAGRVRSAQWLGARGEVDGAFAVLDRTCQALERAASRAQTVAWCLTELAGIQQEREGIGAARALLERALAVQPGYRGAAEGLADLAHARGDWKRAARLYTGIATDAHPDLYLRLAEVHRQLGDAERSAGYERRFLRVATAPGAEALHAHPLALFLAERPETRDAALAVALRDVARRPAVESYDVLGWVRFQRGEMAEALTASDRAHAWGSPSPTLLYRRARILEALGREREAAPLLRQALARPDLLEPHARLGDR